MPFCSCWMLSAQGKPFIPCCLTTLPKAPPAAGQSCDVSCKLGFSGSSTNLTCNLVAGCLWEIVLVGGAHKLIVLAWSFMGTVSFYWLCFSLGMIHMYLSIIYTTTLVMIYFVWEWNYLRWDRFLVHIKYNMCAGAVRHELRSTNKTDNRHCRIKLGRKPASHSKRTPQ